MSFCADKLCKLKPFFFVRSDVGTPARGTVILSQCRTYNTVQQLTRELHLITCDLPANDSVLQQWS